MCAPGCSNEERPIYNFQMASQSRTWQSRRNILDFERKHPTLQHRIQVFYDLASFELVLLMGLHLKNIFTWDVWGNRLDLSQFQLNLQNERFQYNDSNFCIRSPIEPNFISIYIYRKYYLQIRLASPVWRFLKLPISSCKIEFLAMSACQSGYSSMQWTISQEDSSVRVQIYYLEASDPSLDITWLSFELVLFPRLR